jgi:SAM-dependent methyltransferase
MVDANEGSHEISLSKTHRWSTDAPEETELIDMLDLSPDDVVLDFGAGSGRYTLPIAERLEELDGMGLVVACDFSRTLVHRLAAFAKARGLERRVRSICLNDLRPFSLPVARAQADCVLAVNSLHYLDRPLPYLCEVSRVLKPTGELVIADWNSRQAQDTLDPSIRIVKPKQLDPLLREAGMNARSTARPRGYSWVVRATKTVHVKHKNPLLGLAASLPKLSFAL